MARGGRDLRYGGLCRTRRWGKALLLRRWKYLAWCISRAGAVAELELVGALHWNVGAGLLRQGISDEAEHCRGLSASGGV
jgi:hypothetical protein